MAKPNCFTKLVVSLAATAALGVEVLVLPEFSNHAAWYDDARHAWRACQAVQVGSSWSLRWQT